MIINNQVLVFLW